MVVKGKNRDTAWFSILDSEWPVRAQGFRRWLAPENFDAEGKQKRSLAAFNQPAGMAGAHPLRRASLADIPAILALKNAAYTPNESIIGVPSLPRIADYVQVVAEHEVWLTEDEHGLDRRARARDRAGRVHASGASPLRRKLPAASSARR